MGTVVAFTVPGHGHVNPMMSILAELAARGHRVHWFGTPEFKFQRLAGDLTFHSYVSWLPQVLTGDNADSSDPSADTAERLVEAGEVVLREHREQTAALEPDLVITDSFGGWGTLVGRSLGVPVATSSPIMAVNDSMGEYLEDTLGHAPFSTDRFQAARDRMVRVAKEFDVDWPDNPCSIFGSYTDRTIVHVAPRFQPHLSSFDESFTFIGTSLSDIAPSKPIAEREGLIFISFGTVFQQRPDALQQCIDAATATGRKVIVSAGAMADEVRTSGANGCEVHKFVDQREILPKAAAFITHGGQNSVSESFVYEVPMVVLPQGADQPWVARRVHEVGAGIEVPIGADSEAIGASLERVLCEPNFRMYSAMIGASFRRAGGAERGAKEIESLMADHR